MSASVNLVGINGVYISIYMHHTTGLMIGIEVKIPYIHV